MSGAVTVANCSRRRTRTRRRTWRRAWRERARDVRGPRRAVRLPRCGPGAPCSATAMAWRGTGPLRALSPWRCAGRTGRVRSVGGSAPRLMDCGVSEEPRCGGGTAPHPMDRTMSGGMRRVGWSAPMCQVHCVVSRGLRRRRSSCAAPCWTSCAVIGELLATDRPGCVVWGMPSWTSCAVWATSCARVA